MDTPAASPRSAWPTLALLLLLVALAVLRSAVGTRLDGYTIDEPWHAVAGLAYERSGDYSLNPEHPPLVKRWAARFLPGAFVLPDTPVLREKDDERDFVEEVMYGRNDDVAAQARTRVAMWSFHALLLGALGVLLWRALGAPWALGAIGFLALEPTVGAHLPVVMTDLPVALALAVAATLLGLLLSRWRWALAAALGLALGLALCSKHSALPGLGGLAAFAAAGWAWQARRSTWRERGRRAAQLALAGGLAIATLWAAYDFRFASRPDGSDAFNRPLAGKLEDLRTSWLRDSIAFADAHRLLPRAYLWGLADTARVGVEGRGEAGTRLWGTFRPGPPPWYAWPSLVLSKVPLALLAMALLGAFALWRLPLSGTARWTLGALLAMGLGHAASLAGAGGIYAGVRHALPLVVLLAVLGGALLQQAWRSPRRASRAVAFAPLLLALAMTAQEPRLWEYHNELAGGTAQAYRYFENEGIDLGQRQHEVIAFGRRVIAPTGLPLFRGYFGSSPQDRRAGFAYRRRVESIHDDNVAGIYEGFFLTNVAAREPAPEYGYDPKEMLAGLVPVQRFGNVEIWRGRQVQPKSRLGSMFGRVMEYVYSDGGSDWALVAKRTQEIVDAYPQHAPAAIELGNAWLRMGDREAAIRAYRTPLEQTTLPVDEVMRGILQGQIDKLGSDLALTDIAPLRNRAME
jgi:hypothetical protein